MSSDLSRFHQVFFDEAKEHLAEMERLLLALDVAAPAAEDLDAVFRAAHSIKGGSGTFGFNDMCDVTHVLETLLDRVRKGEQPLTEAMVDALLQVGDVLREQLASHQVGSAFDAQSAEPAMQLLRGLIDAPGGVAHREPDRNDADRAVPQSCRLYSISYTPDADAAVSMELLVAELARLGTVEVDAVGENRWAIKLRGAIGEEEIEDVFSFIADRSHYSIELADGSPQPVAAEEEGDGFGFFLPLVAQAEATAAPEDDGFGFFVDAESIAQSSSGDKDDPGYGFFTELSPVASAGIAKASAAVRSGQSSDVPKRRASDAEAETSIRVGVDKVDQLINLVGELVITHAMLAQTIAGLDPQLHQKLLGGIAQLERNSHDLQESVMSIRMLPIGSVFSRFPRLVRDLSQKLGKQVELKLVGETTELDKGLIEHLADPLTHLVRNSLDHGLEAPELRLAAGKPAKGTLTLQAAHQGGAIVVEVIDDGAGLNRQRIVAKARERGLPVDEAASDEQIWPLIFAPGFSTAAQVTDVSGRGVGMDVVKRNIESLGGRVEISSQQGLGTRITIRLPLTLAILDGLSIGVGEQTFILPLNTIIESFQPQPEQISTISESGRVVHVRGDYLPLLALHQLFHIEPRTVDPSQGIVVTLDVDGGKVALWVDALLGQHQVVVKSLERNYRKVRGVSGATIMGDGTVALILDAAALVSLSRS
ncbi:MAG: cheA [Proteobacteria bacterium]|nr:cheA [Pseudomonadota bacterium]